MKIHYRGTTRMEMERAGKALQKKEGAYRCVYACGFQGSHDQMYSHQTRECHWRPGSTVKPK